MKYEPKPVQYTEEQLEEARQVGAAFAQDIAKRAKRMQGGKDRGQLQFDLNMIAQENQKLKSEVAEFKAKAAYWMNAAVEIAVQRDNAIQGTACDIVDMIEGVYSDRYDGIAEMIKEKYQL